MIMDPMANFTKEDWDAIERQRNNESEIAEIRAIKKDIDEKLNIMRLNQNLEFNVKSIIVQCFPELYNARGEALVYKIIEYIKNICQLSIADKKNSLYTAIKIAINHIDSDKTVNAKEILTIYDDLNSYFRDDCLSHCYYQSRKILFSNPKIINYICGTRINKRTSIKRQFAIHEEILNGLHKINKSKIENCSDEYKQIIKIVLLALNNIKFIEAGAICYPKLNNMVNRYKSGFDPTINPDELFKVKVKRHG